MYEEMRVKQAAVRFYWKYIKIRDLAFLIFGIVLICLPIFIEKHARKEVPCSLPSLVNTLDELFFDIAAVETSVETYLVPNYLHFFRFGASAKRLNVFEVLCLLSAFRNQKPNKIFIHTDDVEASYKSFADSSYGKRLLLEPGFTDTLHFLSYPPPKHVLGVPFSVRFREWHMSDLARLRILRKYGGIFLDNDVYLFKNADILRHHELSVLSSSEGLDNSVIAAHRDSRLLNSWITSYMKYDPDISFHHRTEDFTELIENFTPKPNIVENGVVKSNVQKFLSDEIPEMENPTGNACLAVNLNIHPRDELPVLDGIDKLPLYGNEFIERYFSLDKDTRKRVNAVNRVLFNNLSP